MKILMAAHYFLPKHQAGAELYTYYLAKELSKNHYVHLFFAESDLSKKNYSVRTGEYNQIPFTEVINNLAYTSFSETYSNAHIDKVFTKVIDELKPDIIHMQHFLNLSINIIKIAKKRNIPVVFTLHEYCLMCPRYGQRLKENLEICYTVNLDNCAKCVNVQSKFSLAVSYLYNRTHVQESSFYNLADGFNNAKVTTQNKSYVAKTEWTIDGSTKGVISAHPTSTIAYKIRIPNNAYLEFFIVMPPGVYDMPGDGVHFKVNVDKLCIFSQYINPKTDHTQRKWIYNKIDLSAFGGKKVRLSLVTLPGPSGCTIHCAAGWGNPLIQSDLIPVASHSEKPAETYLNQLYDFFKNKQNVNAVKKRFNYILDCCMLADLLIAPSPFLLNEFIKFGIPKHKIIFSDNGMDTSLFQRVEKTFSERIRFSFIGTPAVHKGLHVLVEAFTMLQGDTAELNIYGDLNIFPAYIENLKGMVTTSNVNFVGRFDNSQVGEIFANTDVLVVPSVWFENSPLTIHEAFIAGIPIIASRLGGMADYVKHNVNGLLFEVGNATDLRDKIDLILDNPSILDKLRSGIPDVKTIQEDAQNMVQRYLDLIKK